VRFGTGSFTVEKEVFAHARSGILAAGENPLQPRFSLVVIAGLDAASTRRIAPLLVERSRPAAEVDKESWPAAEVVVFPSGASARAVVVER